MENNKKNVLVIGGTGILGKPLVMQLLATNQFNIYSVALNKASQPAFPASVNEIIIDRYSPEFSDVVENLNLQWEVIIDLIAYNDKSAEQTYSLFKKSTNHIITISTTIVYDRSKENKEPISEEVPLASLSEYGGYADGKIKLERFWKNIKDVNWTLLRPYHIVGKWSLLGCLPYHNRDPKLIEKINNGERLSLVNSGDIPFNYIHPEDIAMAICKIIGNEKAFHQVYNLVNPAIVTGTEYYQEIGRQLGKEVVIEDSSLSKIWEELPGWEMTTLPHIYSVEKLKNDTDFVPSIPLKQGIKDSLENYPIYDIPIEKIPVHEHMNKLPRPKKPNWL